MNDINGIGDVRRRLLLKSCAGAAALAATGLVGLTLSRNGQAAPLTKAQRDDMTPDQIINELKQGNERFRKNQLAAADYPAQVKSTASGQYPSAIILSCIDSRAPAELVFDTGIGEVFNSRVAGNVANVDILGSMEFACALAGAKVVMVMGHTACGAIKGAIDNAQLGNLTELLKKIRPAVDGTTYLGDRSSHNYEFVDAVVKTNVQMAVGQIRLQSQVLADMEKQGKIKIVGSVYNLKDGSVEFLA
jgi:carbonic anhydrase